MRVLYRRISRNYQFKFILQRLRILFWNKKMSLAIRCVFRKLLFLQILIVIAKVQCSEDELDELAVENFRNYLRIESVQPNVNYDECIKFLQEQAKSLDLPVKIVEVLPKKPVLIMTWEGDEPEKPSIFLSGHMDVVSVFPDEWKYPPFEAHMDENGNIYARGSQDMKSVSIMHIEAIRRLKMNGIRFSRTIHIGFIPDEEPGLIGMEAFVRTQEFKDLNVGFGLDEGATAEENQFNLLYAEKTMLGLWIDCYGTAGHGSMLFDNTAGEKMRFITDKFMNFRASEKAKLKDPKVKSWNVTSINLTILRGGVEINVIPNKLSAAFDIRFPPGVSHEPFKNMMQEWFKEAGGGVNYTLVRETHPVENTKLDKSNSFWQAMKKTCDDYDLKLNPIVNPGGSDAHYLRNLGIPAFGFSAINKTPQLAHASNEFLNKDIFLKGIKIFMLIIAAVANI